jgi:hypothetical protein
MTWVIQAADLAASALSSWAFRPTATLLSTLIGV